ncbi:hypothetical protein ABI_01160 [Asticcacaulis biprosthecium C19]|uniref:DUF350 domain-containing protein n=1 Tax=Asticcacaulis biprosthecium C19 TaxID=715226 RepID=F4QHX5_9CAUL|nr:DUF350 domain-containing protein [Asticcacaulis biprosthecium]EGF91686.1 hypothetical protein ABI_01160 [Asticcacaulis biprosthecium C19]
MVDLNSLANLPDYFLFFGAGLLVWGVGLFLYELVTPIKEFHEIRNGNVAVAINLLAVAVAMALPIQSIGHSTFNPADMLLWGGIGIVCQVVLHLIIRTFWKTTYGRLVARGDEKPCIASALLLSGFSLVVGLLNAAALSY